MRRNPVQNVFSDPSSAGNKIHLGEGAATDGKEGKKRGIWEKQGKVTFISGDMKIISGDMKIISRDIKVISGDMKIISGDMKIIYRDIKVISGDIKVPMQAKEINSIALAI
jgi:hypothetical protein